MKIHMRYLHTRNEAKLLEIVTFFSHFHPLESSFGRVHEWSAISMKVHMRQPFAGFKEAALRTGRRGIPSAFFT